MSAQENQIIAESAEVFINKGIKSTSMDDIARELGVSKKTLYKYVANKSVLVDRCVKFVFSQIGEAINHVIDHSNNAIDELFNIDAALAEHLRAEQPSINMELTAHYPGTASWLFQSRREMVLQHTRCNLIKGMEQGLYRPDLHVEIVSSLYFARCSYMSDVNIVPDTLLNDPDFMSHNLIYHIRGIASEAGLKYLEQLLNSKSTQ